MLYMMVNIVNALIKNTNRAHTPAQKQPDNL